MRRLFNYGVDGVMSFNNEPLRLAIYVGWAGDRARLRLRRLSSVFAALVHGVAMPGYVTLVAAVMGLGGLQMLFLGIVGEYVGRIYFEAKHRPHFVVAELSDGLRTVPPRPRHSPRVPVRQTRLVDNIVATDGVPDGGELRDGRAPDGRTRGRRELMLRHAARFVVVGLLNTGVYYACYLAAATVVHYLVAHVVAIASRMVGSFLLNCYWTFRTRPTWRKFAAVPAHQRRQLRRPRRSAWSSWWSGCRWTSGSRR